MKRNNLKKLIIGLALVLSAFTGVDYLELLEQPVKDGDVIEWVNDKGQKCKSEVVGHGDDALVIPLGCE